MQSIHDFLTTHQDEHLNLLLTLARIPAPSGQEEKRAQFCKNWLEAHGAEGVYIDDVLNVIYPIGVTEDNPLVVFAAHSDVVFPDTDPLPLKIEDGKICCPGIGDDTACVAAQVHRPESAPAEKLRHFAGGQQLRGRSGQSERHQEALRRLWTPGAGVCHL